LAQEPDRRGWRETREGPSGKLIVAGVLVVLLLLFVLQNTDEADVDFLFFSGSYPLWVMALVVAVLAFAAGWLVGRTRMKRKLMRGTDPEREPD
jgi:uncharacterized integral membrane protein